MNEYIVTIRVRVFADNVMGAIDQAIADADDTNTTVDIVNNEEDQNEDEFKMKMNIEADEELRNLIKDAIHGQVKSIVRDEFLEIVREEINAKINKIEGERFKTILTESIEKVIEGILRRDFGVSDWDYKFVEPIANKFIDTTASKMNWEKIIDDTARMKIAKLLSEKKSLNFLKQYLGIGK